MTKVNDVVNFNHAVEGLIKRAAIVGLKNGSKEIEVADALMQSPT